MTNRRNDILVILASVVVLVAAAVIGSTLPSDEELDSMMRTGPTVYTVKELPQDDGAALKARKPAPKPVKPRPAQSPASRSTRAPEPAVPSFDGDRSPEASKRFARAYMEKRYGWGDEWSCLESMWTKESNWRWNEDDSDDGYTWGVPQARPGTKMASAGDDWYDNPQTQIKWGLGYIKTRYGSPCNAWDFWQSNGWY